MLKWKVYSTYPKKDICHYNEFSPISRKEKLLKALKI